MNVGLALQRVGCLVKILSIFLWVTRRPELWHGPAVEDQHIEPKERASESYFNKLEHIGRQTQRGGVKLQ